MHMKNASTLQFRYEYWTMGIILSDKAFWLPNFVTQQCTNTTCTFAFLQVNRGTLLHIEAVVKEFNGIQDANVSEEYSCKGISQKCLASNNIIREQVKQLYQIFQSFDLKDDKSGSLVGRS